MPRSPVRATLPLRLASLVLLLFALSGLRLPLPTRARSVAFLIDASDSVGPEGVEKAREAALSMLRGLSRRDRASLLAFAGRPLLLFPAGSPAEAARVLEGAALAPPEGDRTDLGAALSAAARAAGAGRGRPLVVLLSDGRSTSGKSPEASGPPVYVLSLDRAAEAPLSAGLDAPSSARPGERMAFAWSISATEPTEIEWELAVDGLPASRGIAKLAAGPNEVPLEFETGEPGVRELEVSIVLPDGTRKPAAGALVRVEGEQRVLVVSGGSDLAGNASGKSGTGSSKSGTGSRLSPLAAALRTQGFPVLSGGVEDLPERPAGYEGISAVVLDDVHALSLSEGQQEELIDFVAGGGGLLVVGGPSSLGRGEYYSTRLEELLPVSTDARRRFYFTRAKILFVIDRSGSMSEKISGASKQLIAMRGVAAALPELGSQDEVGILGFDSEAFWIMPFTPASRSAAAIASLSGMGEGGGTDMAQAFEEAIKAFGPPGPTKRHVVILTDGLTSNADFVEISGRLKEAGISVSTVGVGAKIDENLLREIAFMNGGSFYRTELDAVPLVIDKEIIRVTRDMIQEGSFTALVREKATLVEGLENAPPLAGYLVTRPKEGAIVHLAARGSESPAGAAPDDALLTTWRYGLGRTAVFAADSGDRWLAAWRGKPVYNRLWSQVLRSIERIGPGGGLRASATVEGSEARIVVSAVDANRRSLSGLHLVGKGPGPGSPAFALRETAPGRYEGDAPLLGEGLGRFEIGDPSNGERTSTWAWSPPGQELAELGADAAALSAIASGSGGAVVDEDAPGLPPPAWAFPGVEARGFLVLVALLLFLAELVIRSAVVGLFPASRLALAAWWTARKAEAEKMKPSWQREDEDERH